MQIYIGKNNYPSADELNGDYKVPKITGVMDADTSSAIAQFQVTNFNRLILKDFLNGRIDPANYKNRRLHSMRPQMSIVLLHTLALKSAAAQGHDYFYADRFRGGLQSVAAKALLRLADRV